MIRKGKDRLVAAAVGWLVLAGTAQASAAIAGRVTGPGGVPVANVAVSVLQADGSVVVSAVTDSNGDYLTASVLAPGGYRVGTVNPFSLIDERHPDQPCPGGHCPPSLGAEVAVTAGNVTTGIDFELAAGARLSGQVTRASDGAPVPGALVVLRQDLVLTLVQTTPDGNWQSPALPAGDWRLFVARTGGLLGREWAGASCDIECGLGGSPLAVSGTAPVAGLDFSLETGAVLAGSVTAAADGAPVPGAQVTVYDPARDRVLAYGFTLPDGSYVTEAFLPGTVKLAANAANFTRGAYGASCEPNCQQDSGAPIAAAAGTASGYNFALQSGGGVRGTVTGPDGPLANVQIVLLRADGQSAGVVVTDAGGHYDTGTSLADGSYRVRTHNDAGFVDEAWPDHACVAEACAATTGDFVAVSTGQTTVADFTLARGARIAGQVRRAQDGTAVSMPTLRLTDASGLSHQFSGGPDGTYDTRTGLPPGDYHLMAYNPAGGGLLSEAWQEQPCTECDALAGTPIAVSGTGVVAGIDFTLDRGATLSGLVLDAATAQPVAGANVIVYDDADHTDILGVGVSGLDGRYTTSAFLPADVRVVAQTPGYLDAVPGATPCDGVCTADESPLLHAEFGDLADVDLDLRRGSDLSGRVLTPGGAPLAGLRVMVLADDYFSETTSDAGGNYAFEALPNGDYLVVVERSGPYVDTAWPGVQCVIDCSLETRTALTLDDDDVRTGVDIAMVEGGTIRGRVEGMPGNIAQPGTVVFYDRETLLNVATATLAGGEYESEPLPPGEYLVFTVTTGGYIDEMFDDVSCPYTCDEDLGAPVALAAGAQATADFELVQGGRIAGRIFNAATNGPLPARPSLQVRAADNTLVWSGTVQSNGNYTTAALPPGTYYVRSRNRSGFLDEFFIDEDCFWCVPVGGIDVHGVPVTPTPVTLTVGATVPNVDLGLLPGSRLAGRVSVEPDDVGAQSNAVHVYDVTGRMVMSIPVLSGDWVSPGGFPPGTYYLRTVSSGLYLDELFGGAPCTGACDVTQGTPVVLTAGVDRTDLVFSLARQPVVFGDGFE